MNTCSKKQIPNLFSVSFISACVPYFCWSISVSSLRLVIRAANLISHGNYVLPNPPPFLSHIGALFGRLPFQLFSQVMRPGSVVMLPKYRMLGGEGQVSVCQGVGYHLLSPFPSATKNSYTWLIEEPFYTHLHDKHPALGFGVFLM